VSLDVLKVGGGLESVILPIQPTHPPKDIKTNERETRRMVWQKGNLQMDVRIAVTNGSNVALEMADIDGIESDLSTTIHEYPQYPEAQEDPELTMVTKSLTSASVRRSPTR
jgi:hypothetical protein